MSKRNLNVSLTKESIALRKLRTKSNLSLGQLSELLKLSKTRVAQMENGRANISSLYIENFLAVTGFNNADWNNEINCNEIISISKNLPIEQEGNSHAIKWECLRIIEKLSDHKVTLLKMYLDVLQDS
jgi:transcriptional regulator with XRE-family HTH domain